MSTVETIATSHQNNKRKMSTVETIATSHVLPSASLPIPQSPVAAVEDWPDLSISKTRNVSDPQDADNDWELLIESQDLPRTSTVSFDKEAVRIEEVDVIARTIATNQKRILKHCQSSPDLRKFVFDETDEDGHSMDEETSGVLIGDGDMNSLASSSMIWVSGPPSVTSEWTSSRLSFRDAVLQKQAAADGVALEDAEEAATETPKSGVFPAHRIRALRKPKYVVQPIRRCSKSTGDLLSLARIVEDDIGDIHDSSNILGETDAHEFYSRKAQGKNARVNGLKTRPDEAKRLQISMAKKDQQRQQQATARKR